MPSSLIISRDQEIMPPRDDEAPPAYENLETITQSSLSEIEEWVRSRILIIYIGLVIVCTVGTTSFFIYKLFRNYFDKKNEMNNSYLIAVGVIASLALMAGLCSSKIADKIKGKVTSYFFVKPKPAFELTSFATNENLLPGYDQPL